MKRSLIMQRTQPSIINFHGANGKTQENHTTHTKKQQTKTRTQSVTQLYSTARKKND